MTIVALLIFSVALLVAVVGLVLPVLPGVPVAAVGALVAAWIVGFERFGFVAVAFVVGLAVLAQLVDLASSWVGARVYGAGHAGLWGGVIGSFAGLILFPPFGFLPGALAGAFLAELVTGRPGPEALRSGFGALVGSLGGIFAKLLIVVAIGVVVYPRLV